MQLHLDDVALFTRIAQLGSLSAAARERDVPVSQVRLLATLTPLELIDRFAALVPTPRTHRHRYFGVMARNSPLRAAVVAMAVAAPAQATLRKLARVLAWACLGWGHRATPSHPSSRRPTTCGLC